MYVLITNTTSIVITRYNEITFNIDTIINHQLHILSIQRYNERDHPSWFYNQTAYQETLELLLTKSGTETATVSSVQQKVKSTYRINQIQIAVSNQVDEGQELGPEISLDYDITELTRIRQVECTKNK